MVCLSLSTPGGRGFPEGDLSFNWLTFPPPSQKSKHSHVEATGHPAAVGVPGEEEARGL